MEQEFNNWHKTFYAACSTCSQLIQEPVCNRCCAREILIWAREQPFNKKIKAQLLLAVRRAICVEDENDVLCAICGNETVSKCTYCYFSKIELTLKQMKIPPESQEDFLELFNYSAHTA